MKLHRMAHVDQKMTLMATHRLEPDLSVFPASLVGRYILLCTESFGPVNGVSRTTLMLVTHLRRHGAHVVVVAPRNHSGANTFVPSSLKTTVLKTPKAGALVAAAGEAEEYNGDKGDLTPTGTATAPSRGRLLVDTSKDDDVIRVGGYQLPFNPELSVVYPLRLQTLLALASPQHTTSHNPHPPMPDLIYLASPASLGFQVMLYLRQLRPASRPPVIANFQTDLAGYCAILFPEPLASLATRTFGAVQGYLFRDASVNHLFYPSSFVRRYLERIGVPDDKMEVLQRGVDVELFSPARRSVALRREILGLPPRETAATPDPEEDDALILVTVARLAGEKGFEFLSRVAALLHERGNVKFKLYIVGGNRNAAVEAEVKSLFQNLTTAGIVSFPGFRVGEALATCYASGDVFLHCSVTETFGLVVLEALASGLPVVARDEGGPSDFVPHGSTGFLIPPADLQGFVLRVEELGRNKEMRRRMGRAGREYAESMTWEKINIRVAWRMAQAIEAKEKKTEADMLRRQSMVDAWGDGFHVAAVIKGREVLLEAVVSARLWAAILVVFVFWAAVGPYLLFSKANLWVKNRSPIYATLARIVTRRGKPNKVD